MPTPSAQDVFDFLEKYNLGLTTCHARTGNTVLGSTSVANIDTTSLARGMSISGAGIAAETRIASIDGVIGPAGSLTMTKAAVADGTGTAMVVTYYGSISEDWIVKCRDQFVIPYITNKLKMTFNGIQEIEEYYSGNGGSILVLRRRPIVDLVSISYTNVVTNQYFISPLAVQIIRDEGILKARANFNESNYVPMFARGDRNLRIRYTVGGTDYPEPIARAITLAVADRVLEQIGARTGGGSLTVQGYGRQFGEMGKWTDIRRGLGREINAILRMYMTGVTQA